MTKGIKYALVLFFAVFFISYSNAFSKKKFKPTWESIAKAKPASWWEKGKFGIFIHWGPYSVAGYKDGNKGYAEAITHDMYSRPEKYKDFFIKKFGAKPPEFGYKDWIPLFTASKWNPNEWAALFKKSGAKYVIPTAEHHDGFANWDSDLTDWCATKMGPHRDLVGDLGKAVRKQKLKYGLSYHRERHPSRFAYEFKVHGIPLPEVAEEIKMNPKCAELYGPFDYSDAFIKDYVARWEEVQKKYRPDFMWIDDIPIFSCEPNSAQVKKFENAYKYMISNYLNAADRWGKEVYFNNKGKHLNFPCNVGCISQDNMKLDTIGPRWQNPATIGVSYAYMENEDVNDLYKTPGELIHLLADVVSKNGNLLLNIGPRADGTIPNGMKTRLLAMGKWLKVNGDAIYGTSPWLKYGEYSGPIITEKGVHYDRHSIRIHKKEYRYTKKGKNIYVIAFQKDDGDVLLESFKNFNFSKIEKIQTINGGKVKWEFSDAGLILKNIKDKDKFYLSKVYKIILK